MSFSQFNSWPIKNWKRKQNLKSTDIYHMNTLKNELEKKQETNARLTSQQSQLNNKWLAPTLLSEP